MIRTVSIFFSFALATCPVFAQNPEDCVGIENPDDRLNCFDAAFIDTELPAPALGNNWNVRIDRSQLDDSTAVYMHVNSEEPLRDRFRTLGPAALWIRCSENRTSVFIHFAGHFMSDLQGRGRVDFRVDDREADRVVMTASNNHEALGLWSGNGSIPFIRRNLLDGDSIYMRATPHSESPVEMRFNISGLSEQIAPLREACDW